MHVLIIPSEEYLPERSPLAGIFQYHQLCAIKQISNLQVGLISVSLRHSVPMLIKALSYKLIRRKVTNDLKNRHWREILRILYSKLFHPMDFINSTSHDGVPIIRCEGLYLAPPSPKYDHISWIRIGMLGVSKYIQHYGKPDFIHAHNALNGGLLAQQVSKRYGIPYLLTEHSSYYQQGLVPSALIKLVYRSVSQAIVYTTVSGALKTTMRSMLGSVVNSAKVLPNVLPPQFETGKKIGKTQKNFDRFVFLVIGNFLPVKNKQLAVKALSELPPSSRILIRFIGDGPLKQEVTNLVRNLEVESRVEFLGQLNSTQIVNQMKEAHSLLLPSRIETFGVVLIEAMSMGLPIVATACGGPNEIIDENVGLLVTPDDELAMTQAMLTMEANHRNYDSRKISQLAISRYGANAYNERFKELLSSMRQINTNQHSIDGEL